MTVHFAALILAAGSSRRMGDRNKLLLNLGGLPIVAHVLDAVQASRVSRICVVLGHEADSVHAALAPRAAGHVQFVTNPDYRTGIASSLICGLRMLGSGDRGVVVCLGDMPRIGTGIIDALCSALRPADYAAIPVWEERWGNPVLLSAAAIRDAAELSGDRGARALLEARRAEVREVPASSAAILRDIDEPGDL